MTRPLNVFIVFHGGDAEDDNLVRQIQAAVSSTVSGAPMTIGELIDYSTRAPLSTPLPGVTVVILSQAMIDNSRYREVLVKSVVGSRGFSFRHYFICRGISLETVKTYSDLARIFESAVVVAEQELPELITDVNRYVSKHTFPSQATLLLPGLKLVLGTSISVALTAIERLSGPLLGVAATLGILLYMHVSPPWVGPLVYLCLFLAGLWLVRVHTLDLWPWLGRQWKFPIFVDEIYLRPLNIGFGPLAYWGMAIGILGYLLTRQRLPVLIVGAGFLLQTAIDLLSVRCLRVELRAQKAWRNSAFTAEHSLDTVCSEPRLNASLSSCLVQRRLNVVRTFGAFALLLVLALFSAARLPSYHPALYTIAFLAGLIMPIAKAWSALLATREAGRFKGLTKEHLKWNAAMLRRRGVIKGPPPSSAAPEEVSLDHFTEAERLRIYRWLSVYRAPRGHAIRRWLTPIDYAFISYAWRDDSEIHMSERLAGAFATVGVNHFLDRKDVPNKFLIWREHVAPALLRCTHIFLVVSPGIKCGDTVLREIEATLNRWYLESLPAVICIAEPDTARFLREDPKVSLELRFLLTCCPLMSFEEALEPGLLQYIIRHTRRQGMLQNWITVLSGTTALQRITRMRGIVEVEKSVSNQILQA